MPLRQTACGRLMLRFDLGLSLSLSLSLSLAAFCPPCGLVALWLSLSLSLHPSCSRLFALFRLHYYTHISTADATAHR